MKRNISKFILSGIILCLTFLVIDHCIGFALQYMEAENREHLKGFKLDFVLDKVDKDILIVGSSRASHHYVPQILEEKFHKSVYNCGEDGRFFLYQTAVINHILDRYSPKLIIWEAEPSALSFDELDIRRISYLSSYYDTDRYMRNLINLRSKFEQYKMSSMLYRYNNRGIAIINSLFKKDSSLNKQTGYQPLANSGYKFPELRAYRVISNNLEERNVKLFREILQKCNNRKTYLVLVFSPRFTDDNALETLQCKKLYEVANEFNVPIADFYHHPAFMSDPSLFKDINHLNDSGAQLFTERLCEELEKLAILKSAQTNN